MKLDLAGLGLAGPDDGSPLEIRVFRWVSLATGLLAPMSIPLNVVFHVPPLVNWVAALLCVGSLLTYWASLRGRHHQLLYLVVAMLVLDVLWWVNGGVEGSITYFFIPGMLYIVALMRGATRVAVAVLLVVNVLVLFVVDYHLPTLHGLYDSESDALADHAVSIVQALIVSGASTWLIIGAYDRERSRTARFAADLAARERNYRALVENARSVIARLDLQGNVLFVNHYAEQLFGLRREAVIGRPAVETLMTRLPADARGAAAPGLAHLLVQSATPEFETEHVCEDRRRIRVRWTGQRVEAVGEEPEHVLCVGDDITDRHLMLEQLRLTQTSVDASADQIIWTDDGGRIVYANAAAANAVGYSRQEMRALAVADIAPEAIAQNWPEHWQRLRAAGQVAFEATERRRDGGSLPVEVTVTYLKVMDREYATAIIRDVSERKQAEREQRALREQLFNAQKMEAVGRLAGGVAHEFNNILQIVTGYTALARKALAHGADAGRDLDKVLEAAQRGSALTAQFLALGRRARLQEDVLDLSSLLEDHSNVLRPMFGERIELVFAPAAEVGAVRGDAALLQQMLTNLCLNARDAMPAGGRLQLGVRNVELDAAFCRQHAWARPGAFVEVTVADTGTGMDAELRERIFEPFFTTKEVGEGSGLGLSVVLGIVEQHHGLIAVESTVGQGTTFSVLLPRLAERAAPAAEAEPAAPAAGGAETILVAEDEPDVRAMLVRVLQDAGYAVLAAADGVETMEVFAAHAGRLALVLLDAILPRADLPTVLARIRAIRPDARIVVSSGYGADAVRPETLAAEGIRLLPKPYAPGALLRLVRDVLDEA